MIVALSPRWASCGRPLRALPEIDDGQERIEWPNGDDWDNRQDEEGSESEGRGEDEEG